MDTSLEARLAEFVKPLHLGVDGASRFDRVLRVQFWLPLLRAEESGVDEELLRLMTYFHDLDGWLMKMGNRGRAELFLAGCGMPEPRVRRLIQGVLRFRSQPRSTDECLLHDAVMLVAIGRCGVAEVFWRAGRERWTLPESLAELERLLEAARFTTATGERLACDRLAFARTFLADLRAEAGEAEAAVAATAGIAAAAGAAAAVRGVAIAVVLSLIAGAGCAPRGRESDRGQAQSSPSISTVEVSGDAGFGLVPPPSATVKVVLIDAGKDRARVLELLRAIDPGLSPPALEERLSALPVTLAEGISPTQAEALESQFAAAGAQVRLE